MVTSGARPPSPPDHPSSFDRAVQLVSAAEESRLPLRVLGGVGIAIRCNPHLARPLRTDFNDLDLITRSGFGLRITKLLHGHGYEPSSQRLHVLHLTSRLFLQDSLGFKVDVFVGDLEMCHVIRLNRRLEIDRMTIPLADLLLSKLQIVRLTQKDRLDVYSLLLAYDIKDSDDEAINGRYIAGVCSADWGLWRTVTKNLELCAAGSGSILSESEISTVRSRVDNLLLRNANSRKTPGWILRSLIGERVPWYEEPEEIQL